MSGFTKGPWKVINAGGRTGKSQSIAGLHPEYVAQKVMNADDARLIAASQQLLAVAEMDEALDSCDDDKIAAVLMKHGWDWDGDFTAAEFVREMRRAAIAKATAQ